MISADELRQALHEMSWPMSKSLTDDVVAQLVSLIGIVRADVRLLRSVADLVIDIEGGHYHTEEGDLLMLANRIEILLDLTERRQ